MSEANLPNLAYPSSERSVSDRGHRRACLIMTACWAVPLALTCATAVAIDAIPSPTPDGRPIPGWLDLGSILAAILMPLAVLVLVPLAVIGFRHLRRCAPGRRWSAAWKVIQRSQPLWVLYLDGRRA
jgi:hypothetical protein